MMTDVPESGVPEHLGPYKVGELLGRGGMGSVYAATHTKSGDHVAVKVIATSISEEPRFRRRFATEIEALRLLSHPAIVKLIGYGEEDGLLFYSMERIDGPTLQKRIRLEKRIAWPNVVDWSIAICGGLKHAHDIGVTHRDLKPANLILLDENQVKIVDFGIPKIFGDSTDQTVMGSMLGTPDFMAPEQAGTGMVTSRTDLYCLGSTMYAALSGRPPFRGKNVTDVVTRLRRDPPPHLGDMNLDVPEALTELIHDLLEKDPGDRPPTALAVANRLKSMRAALMDQRTQIGDSAACPSDPNVENHAATVVTAGREKSGSEQGRLDHRGANVDNDVRNPSTRLNDDAATIAVSESKLASATASNPESLEISHASLASHTAATLDSLPAKNENEVIEEPVTKSTHFESVDGTDRRTRAFERPHESKESHHAWISGVGLVLVVGAIVAALIIAARPPSADKLYADAMQTRDIDAGVVFLRRFPDEERYIDVETMVMEERLDAVERRLQTRDKIGRQPLSPGQSAFMEAIGKRSTEPSQASESLYAWLRVFADGGEADANDLVEMSELATFFARRWSRTSVTAVEDPRLSDLRAKVDRWSKLPKLERRQKIRDLVNMFAEEPWAKPIIEPLQQELQDSP